MKYLFNIAYKDLFNSKHRTIASIIAIAVSVCIVIVVRGFILGFLDSMLELNIQYDLGHIKIIDQEYHDKQQLNTLNYPVDGFEGEGVAEMVAQLENISGVTHVIPRLKFSAAASYNDELFGVMGYGVKPAEELAFTRLKTYLVEGRMIEEGQREVVMGAGLLKELKLKVGDKFTFFYTTAFGSFKGSTFNIVGKIKSGMGMLDNNMIYLPLDQAQRILEMEDEVTEILLAVPNYKEVNTVVPAVNEFFDKNDSEGRYTVLPWNKTGGLVTALSVVEKIYNIIYILLVVLACFVVINVMYMIVKERTQEIGMMSALGLGRREILFLFIFEGFFMGFAGSLLGTFLGGFVTKIFSNIGINFAGLFEKLGEEVLMSPSIYPVFSIGNLIFAFVLGIFLTVITCIFPARKAANMEPTEALRSI